MARITFFLEEIHFHFPKCHMLQCKILPIITFSMNHSAISRLYIYLDIEKL